VNQGHLDTAVGAVADDTRGACELNAASTACHSLVVTKNIVIAAVDADEAAVFLGLHVEVATRAHNGQRVTQPVVPDAFRLRGGELCFAIVRIAS
jgi:hypothetical protein